MTPPTKAATRKQAKLTKKARRRAANAARLERKAHLAEYAQLNAPPDTSSPPAQLDEQLTLYRLVLKPNLEAPNITCATYWRLAADPDEALAMVPLAPVIDLDLANWQPSRATRKALYDLLQAHRAANPPWEVQADTAKPARYPRHCGHCGNDWPECVCTPEDLD